MDKADARRDRQPFVNAGIVLSWVILPLLSVALFRRMTQHKLPPPLVVTSENIEQVAEALEEAEPLPTIIPSGELPMAEPLMSTPEPEALAKSVSPFDDVFKLDKPEPPAPKPFIQQPPIKWPSKPLEPIRMQPAKPPEPMPPVEPIKPPEPVRMEPLKPPEPIYVQPPKPPEPIKPPELEPVAAAPAPVAPARPFERILETERVVSESLVRGNQFAAEGNIEMARREYRTAAALSTVSVDAQLGLAYLCFLQEQWDLSMQHYLNAIQINPRSADAHYGLGRVLMELNRVNDAIPELRKALELDPTLFDAQETLTSLGQLA
jgi:tetratricopeptide (TPR) repeat protein